MARVGSCSWLAALAVASLAATAAVGDESAEAPKFVKDDGMDTEFPPPVQRHPELPPGHLRPLGHQRPSDGPVDEARSPPGAVQFFADFVQRQRPLVVRGAVSPTAANWTDEQLRAGFGHVRVAVTHKKELLRGSVELMPLADFLARYRHEDLYVATPAPVEMEDGLQLPGLAQCGPVSRGLWQAELWLSAGGTGSLLHYHGRHQLHCAATGRKDFVLVEPRFKDNLRCREEPPGSGDGRSELDVDMISGFEEPLVQQTPWRHAQLLAGDCLYIPPGHLHQVRSYGRSLSYTVLFACGSDTRLADCRTLGRDLRSLRHFSAVWTGDNGRPRLREAGELTADSLRRLLAAEADRRGGLSAQTFASFFAMAKAAAPAHVAASWPTANQQFRQIAGRHAAVLTVADIRRVATEPLQQLATVFNSVRPPRRDEL